MECQKSHKHLNKQQAAKLKGVPINFKGNGIGTYSTLFVMFTGIFNTRGTIVFVQPTQIYYLLLLLLLQVLWIHKSLACAAPKAGTDERRKHPIRRTIRTL